MKNASKSQDVHRWRAYTAAIVVTLFALAIRFVLDPFLKDHLPYVTFFVAVAAVVWYARRLGPSLLAVVLGFLASTWFFVSPRGTLALVNAQSQLGAGTYFMVTLAFVGFGHALQRNRERSEAIARELDEERERLRVTLASVGDAVIVCNTEGLVTFLNAVAEELTGWPTADATGKPLEEVFRIINEETRKPVESPGARALYKGVVVGLANHTLLIRRDSVELPIDDSAAPIRDAQGNVTGVVLIFRDISERRKAEETLRQSNELHRLTVETSPDGIITMDERSIITGVNPATEKIFGYTATEIVGQSMTILIPERMRTRHREGVKRFLASGERSIPWSGVELPGLHKDGGEVPLEISFGTHVKDGRRFFIGTMRDITQRKHAERATTLLAAIVASSDDAIISKDLNSVITSWNKGAERIFGYTAQEAIGQSITMLIPADRQHEEPQIIARLKRGEIVDHFETIRVRKDGTPLDISLTISPLMDSTGRVIGASKIARDVTERKKREAFMQSEAKRLEVLVQARTAKLQEAIGELEGFSYSVAHDVRAPLRAMQGYADAVLRDEASTFSTQSKTYLGRIRRASARLDQLTQEVLSYAQLSRQEAKLRTVDLDKLAHEVLEHYPHLCVGGNEIRIASPLLPVLGDETLLIQALSNLLVNACKFVAPGITPRVLLRTEAKGENVRLWVEDNGIGIAPEHRPRIFSLFGRIHPEEIFPGTGVGLMVVKKAAQRLGGEAGFESEPGRGSRFWLELRKP